MWQSGSRSATPSVRFLLPVHSSPGADAEPLPGSIRLHLKYARDRKCVVQGLKRVSKPSLRVYVGSQEIKPVCSGLGISILSTSEGVMTGKKARNAKVGGEVICEVW